MLTHSLKGRNFTYMSDTKRWETDKAKTIQNKLGATAKKLKLNSLLSSPSFKLCVSSGNESNVLTPLHINFSTLSLSISAGLGSLSITIDSRELERGSHWSNKALRSTRLSLCRLSLAEIFRFSDFTICSVLILSLKQQIKRFFEVINDAWR